MLAKKRRLKKQKDFKKVFNQGRAYYGKLLGLKATPNNLLNNRYGIIISCKVSKKAVERNKLKRQLRVIIKEFDQSLIKGIDVVIITLPAILHQEPQKIENELKKVFIKLKLFN